MVDMFYRILQYILLYLLIQTQLLRFLLYDAEQIDNICHFYLPAPLQPAAHPAIAADSSLPSSQSSVPSQRKAKSIHVMAPSLQPNHVHEQFCKIR